MNEQERIARALAFIASYADIDSAHHKQWVFDQIVRILTGDKYNEWVRVYNDTYGTAWDEGIAP